MRITPEATLLWAVLERAIIDYTGKVTAIGTENAAYWERSARGWVRSDSREPFSFNWICEELGLDRGKTRRYIRNARPEFEPAARSAVCKVLSDDPTVLYEVEKEHRRTPQEEVECERKRA